DLPRAQGLGRRRVAAAFRVFWTSAGARWSKLTRNPLHICPVGSHLNSYVEDQTKSLHHARPGEVVSLDAAPGSPQESQTTTLIKTASLEVIRLVLPAGKEIEPHRVTGEITLQCLSGRVTLQTPNGPCELASGTLTFL